MQNFLLLLFIIRWDYGVVINHIEKAVETTCQNGLNIDSHMRELTKLTIKFLEERNCSSTTFIELRMITERPHTELTYRKYTGIFSQSIMCKRINAHGEYLADVETATY